MCPVIDYPIRTGYRLILDHYWIFGSQERKVLIEENREDTRQMFQVASGVTAVQEGTYRISRAGIIPGNFRIWSG